jgi:hypothetical protein
MSPRAGLGAEVRGKIPCFCQGSNPGRPVVDKDESRKNLPTVFTWPLINAKKKLVMKRFRPLFCNKNNNLTDFMHKSSI